MLRDKDTIASLRRSARMWREEADEQKLRAERYRREAEEFSRDFERAVEKLALSTCPFCGGEMVDLSRLEDFAQELKERRMYLHQGESFSTTCQSCGTFETGAPRETALRWTDRDVERGSKVFAAKVLDGLHLVDEVALERAAGRGWMFRIGDRWYANRSKKKELEEVWKI